jgi:hypothetical protein
MAAWDADFPVAGDSEILEDGPVHRYLHGSSRDPRADAHYRELRAEWSKQFRQ